MGTRLLSVGRAVPSFALTNEALEAMLETSDQWIRERSGIKTRFIGGTVTSLAAQAVREAAEAAGLAPSEVSGIVLATSTADWVFPPTSAAVARELGIEGFVMDLQSACAGFVYALVVGERLLDTHHKYVAVAAADALSSRVSFADRSTAVLFGDAGGAVIAAHSPEEGSFLLGHHLGSEPRLFGLLYSRFGGPIRMAGREVFKNAVKASVASARTALARAGIETSQVDFFLPHQANQRIIEAVAERLSIPEEKCISAIAEGGNTSAPSIPVALYGAVKEGRVKDGSVILLSGFGAGMTVASAVIRWGK
jgi:3-oxoacyl-[acyl-carrier-protein] synthase-3